MKKLADAGIDMKHLSVVGKGYHTDETVVGFYNTGDRMKFWGKRGAFWGGLWGWLFGGVFMFIPVIGHVVVLGYLATVVVSAVEGAAVVGGLSVLGAALYSSGIPKDSVLAYETAINADNFLVTAHGSAEEMAPAKAILGTLGASRADLHEGVAGSDSTTHVARDSAQRAALCGPSADFRQGRKELSDSAGAVRSVIMSSMPDPRANRLIAALPEPERQRWLPQLEAVELPLGEVLYESRKTLSHVYFPTTAIVSLLYVMEDGASAEIAVVGNEGLVGISLFMGGESTPSRAVVQSAGYGFRLSSHVIKEEFKRAPVLHLLLRYTQALITQMAQTAVCNRHHSLDQQLCRWLLLSLDRLRGDELVMTQELIANMLGVRREGVTEGALKLQTAGLIRYARGHITVLDRKGLERRVCKCYAVVKKEYDRLLPDRLAI